jgi:glutamate-1-semialdehyde aminotransferase
MAAIRLARGHRAAEDRQVRGHYHGWYDDVLLSSHPYPIAALGHLAGGDPRLVGLA